MTQIPELRGSFSWSVLDPLHKGNAGNGPLWPACQEPERKEGSSRLVAFMAGVGGGARADLTSLRPATDLPHCPASPLFLGSPEWRCSKSHPPQGRDPRRDRFGQQLEEPNLDVPCSSFPRLLVGLCREAQTGLGFQFGLARHCWISPRRLLSSTREQGGGGEANKGCLKKGEGGLPGAAMGIHLGTRILDSKPVESAFASAPQRSRASNPPRLPPLCLPGKDGGA